MPRPQLGYEHLGVTMREGRRVFATSDDMVVDFFSTAEVVHDIEDEDPAFRDLTQPEYACAVARGDFDLA